MTHPPAQSVNAIVRLGLNSPNAVRLVQFYEQAFGAQVERRDRQVVQWAEVQSGAARIVLKLGKTTLEFREFDCAGQAYPKELSPYDTRFQHFAIVVTDMRRAVERLNAIVGWTAISTEGPQTLPLSVGGVTAFKFRDPDGHPLELLQFATGKIPHRWEPGAEVGDFLGIDHSAMSVLQVDRSVSFYQSLGFNRSARTLNQGIEQQRLDGVSTPVLDVIALTPPTPTPHVELLHYRSPSQRSAENLAINDIAAARLIMTQQVSGKLLQDPDGHFLELPDGADGC